MKKRTISILFLGITITALLLAGCSGGTSSSSSSSDGETAKSSEESAAVETSSDSASAETEDAAADEREWWEYADVDWNEQTIPLSTGINLTYLTLGPEDGEPIVLIHGATDSRLSWSQVAPELAEQGFRIYIPELRGHGKTDKPDPESGAYTVEDHTADIIAFLDAAQLDAVHVAGHSLGTLIAQRLAAEVPDRIKSITLIASGPASDQNEVLDWVIEGDGEEYFGLDGYEAEGELPDSFIREWTETSNEDPDFAEGIYRHARGLSTDDWKYIFYGLKQFNNTDGLSDITCPVLIIWGTADILFTEEDQQALQDGLVNAADVRYETIEGASHNVHWDSKTIAAQVAGLIGEEASLTPRF